MAGLKSESLSWVDKLEKLRAQPPNASRAELKEALQSVNSHITDLQNIGDCLDPKAIEKVRQAANGNPPYILSFNNAKALATLKGKVEDLSGAAHAALDVTLTRRLTTKKIKNLVAWVIGGKPASEFDPKANPQKPQKPAVSSKDIEPDLEESEAGKTKKSSQTDPLDLKKIRQMVEKTEAERIQGTGTANEEKLLAHILKIASSLSKDTKTASTDDGLFETIFQDWLADIPVIAQIKSKVKKKKPLTKGEEALLALHKAGGLVGRGLKGFFKVFKPLFRLVHFIGKLVVEALKELGLYKYAKGIFTLVMLVAALWFAWEAWRYGVMRPVEMVWSKIPWGQLSRREPVISASDVPPPGITLPAASPIVRSAELGSSKLKTSNSSLQTTNSTAVTYAPAALWMPAAENPKVLETEIAAIPDNSRVEDSPVTLDESMPGDLAVSRLQDLTDADRYTMKIGHDTEKILSVNATINNLIINYKSTDLLGVFGGGGPVSINFFCEDIKAIHSSEIDVEGKNPVTLYQVTLVEEGAKIPLTIQCAAAEDQQHLVSTMEYFIRNSRLGRDTALTGIPYPLQGLVFDNELVVEKLWADSPADKAGLQLGDHLWSVGTAEAASQEKKDFEKELASLPATLFAASPQDWDKASIAKNSGMTSSFRPKLRKLIIAGL